MTSTPNTPKAVCCQVEGQQLLGPYHLTNQVKFAAMTDLKGSKARRAESLLEVSCVIRDWNQNKYC